MSNREDRLLELGALAERLLPTPFVVEAIQGWFMEDGLGQGDVTSTSIVEPTDRVTASLVAREAMIVSGIEPLIRAFATPPLAGRLVMEQFVDEGMSVKPGTVIGRIQGGRRSVLAAERTILNVLGRLAGVASMTRRFVLAVEGTPAVICDTRKTTPGLRAWEKYAVACGGGTLHRLGLHDAALFKDNHLVGIPEAELHGRLEAACREARAGRELDFVEVEVDTLAQFDIVLALEAGLVDIVLLDNMRDEDMREAVVRRDLAGSGIQLEASGGINLDDACRVAGTGVERIAVGSVTRTAQILDIGLDIQVDA
ncbi:MAG: carboxylating nicotinate-nucleotide diphosphorylase [Phycisphaerales bacterium]|nr:carboxylating nicotinate-nucleotide diphosphorylase [Phycisphaerales bacterium]